MKHLNAINKKAARVVAATEADVVGLQQQGPPQQPEREQQQRAVGGAALEHRRADHAGGTAGLCSPVERDLFDCHMGCFWPAHVPDQLNHAPDWTAKCAVAQKDWRKIDLVFPG